MSSFSRTKSSSNERLFNQNESSKLNQSALDKKSTHHQSSISPQSNISSPQPGSQSNLQQQSTQFKMSISPSLSSANSNQSSAASSVNSLIDNQEELTNLTKFVKHFREQLSKLRRIIANEIGQRDEHSVAKELTSKELSNKDLYSKSGRDLHSREQSRDLSNQDLSKESSSSKYASSKELIDKQEMFKAQVHDKLADVSCDQRFQGDVYIPFDDEFKISFVLSRC